MKGLLAAAAILCALLAGSLFNAQYLSGLTGALSEDLSQAQRLVEEEENWARAWELTRRAYQLWQDRHTYLHCTLRHADTDLILRSFRGVQEYLELEELDQYLSANADLVTQLQLLAELEQPTLVNVL